MAARVAITVAVARRVNPVKRIGILFSVLLLAFSCGRPASDELFSLLREDGTAEFTLDMADTLEYSLSLFLYADGVSPSDSVEVELYYLSPSGAQYSEAVLLGGAELSAGGNRNLYYKPLRPAFTPVVYGMWQAAVVVEPELVAKYKITGAGLRLNRNGTR